MKTDQYKLIGAARLPLKGDTIGFAVFSLPKTNSTFTIETDHFLRISKFKKVAVEGSNITYFNSILKDTSYLVGDFAPIPLWADGQLSVVPGGVGLDELLMDIGEDKIDKFHVFRRLASIIQRARDKEFASGGEIEDFWSCYRFIIQNMAGGDRWVARYCAVVRQSSAYLRPDSIEHHVIEQLTQQWVDRYITQSRFSVFDEFVRGVERLANKDKARIVISVSIMERLISDNNTEAVLSYLPLADCKNISDCVKFIDTVSETDIFARRHNLPWFSRVAAKMERCFEEGHFEQLAMLVDTFGRIRLPNHLLYQIPKIIDYKLGRLETMETQIRDANFEKDPAKVDILDKIATMELKQITALARLAGGREAVEKTLRLYRRVVNTL